MRAHNNGTREQSRGHHKTRHLLLQLNITLDTTRFVFIPGRQKCVKLKFPSRHFKKNF